MSFVRTALAGCFSVICAHAAMAEPTEIVVRVLAKDAKFIGHNEESGGMRITLRDADTGELLAEGLSEGGRGQTDLLMRSGHLRRQILSPGSASFSATLDLQRPRRITVTATGPLMLKENALSVSATQWVLPGKSINGGDGWVLELPGFAVLLAAPVPASVELSRGEAMVPIRAKITMQCACIVEPGGLWDPAKFEIGAMLEKNGKMYPMTPLAYAGEPNMFTGEIAVREPGDYTIYVYAYDASNGNTGLVKVPVTAR